MVVRKSLSPIGVRWRVVCASSQVESGEGVTLEPRRRQRSWWPKQTPLRRMSGRLSQISAGMGSGGEGFAAAAEEEE